MSRHLTTRQVLRLLSVRALAEASTIPASSIYSLIARGELAHYRIGRSVRVAEKDWLEYTAAQREVRS